MIGKSITILDQSKWCDFLICFTKDPQHQVVERADRGAVSGRADRVITKLGCEPLRSLSTLYLCFVSSEYSQMLGLERWNFLWDNNFLVSGTLYKLVSANELLFLLTLEYLVFSQPILSVSLSSMIGNLVWL